MSTSPPGSPLAKASGLWKHGPIPVIGLIGGIGSGKSQVAALLAQRGMKVIDADAVGHRVLEDPEVRRQVVKRFGESVLGPSAQGPIAPRSDRPEGAGRDRLW